MATTVDGGGPVMSIRFSSLRHRGIDFVAAVPCSFLKRFLAGCQALPSGRLVPAVREDHAVAACAGAWLGGARPLAAMQNSGLGYCLEVLASLHLLYEIPLPMVVSDRGFPQDYEEHRDLGQRTRALLDLFGISWREGAAGQEDEDADWLLEAARATCRPAVLLLSQEADS